MSEYLLTWAGEGTPRRWEQARAEVALGRLRARGIVLVGGERPYQMDYELDTAAGLVTRRLLVRVAGLGWARELLLTRDSDGDWSARRTAEPDDGLEVLADSTGLIDLAGALDVEMDGSPLTATMPVLRHVTHRRNGRHRHRTARVRVPDLVVAAGSVTYSHVRTEHEGDGGVVLCRRERDPGPAGERDLDSVEVEFGEDGFVTDYPYLARRV